MTFLFNSNEKKIQVTDLTNKQMKESNRIHPVINLIIIILFFSVYVCMYVCVYSKQGIELHTKEVLILQTLLSVK